MGKSSWRARIIGRPPSAWGATIGPREFVARGYEVAYISDPISPFHLLGGLKEDLAERFRIYRSGGVKEKKGKLWAYVPGAWATPHPSLLLRSAWLHRRWHRLTAPNLHALVEHQGFGQVDLLYIDSLVQTFWLDRIKARKTLFRMTDDLPSMDKATPAFAQLEKETIQKVDAVTYTALSLEEKIQPLHPKCSFYIPAGIHNEDFRGPNQRTIPEEYKNIPKPIAVYVGTLGSRFDANLLALAAKRLPKVSFVLICPEDEARFRLPSLPNLHILGTRPYPLLPPYLWNADLGLIPLDAQANPGLVHHTHPLKLYQYMACGLPVVTTEWETIRKMKSPVFISRYPVDFIKNVQRALAQKKPVQKNIRFAQKHEWKNRLKEVFRWLEEKPGPQRQAGRVRTGK